MYRKSPGRIVLIAVLAMGFMNSCIGSKSDITIRRDGSGSIDLEYRISRTVEALGKQEGNEPWPTLPAGRADFERTVSRIEGLELRSFAVKNEEKDLVYAIKLDFQTPEALLRFLDAPGQGVRWEGEGEDRSLFLTLGSGRGLSDPALPRTASGAFQGYDYEFRVTLPGTASLRLTDREGRERPLPPGSRVSAEGNHAAFLCPMAELVSLEGPLVMEIRWRQ
jgi:hypothetical protein